MPKQPSCLAGNIDRHGNWFEFQVAWSLFSKDLQRFMASRHALCFFTTMKKVVYRAKGGFITATIAPLPRKQERKFGLFDATIIVALIVGTIALMRMLVAH